MVSAARFNQGVFSRIHVTILNIFLAPLISLSCKVLQFMFAQRSNPLAEINRLVWFLISISLPARENPHHGNSTKSGPFCHSRDALARENALLKLKPYLITMESAEFY